MLSILAGEITAADAARQFKMSEQSIGTWKRRFLQGGRAGLESKDSGAPSREAKLEAEVEELKAALGEATVELRVMKISAMIGIPRRTYHRHLAAHRRGKSTGKRPWPAPSVETMEPVTTKYAADWPAWRHRKIHVLMAADGHQASASTVQQALRRRGLLQPIGYQDDGRELAKDREAAFAKPPTRPNEVWQLDFSEYETTADGVWRVAGSLTALPNTSTAGMSPRPAPVPMRSRRSDWRSPRPSASAKHRCRNCCR